MISEAAQCASRFPGGFTVLMSVYGGDDPALFDAALGSLKANTLQPDHMVLVIDGPISQGLEDIVQRWQPVLGFCVVRLPRNVGLANALNAGLKEVRTEWIARADADDFNLPGRFECQARLAASGAGDVIGGAIMEVNRDGAALTCRILPSRHEDILRFARRRNPVNHMTVVMRASLVRQMGGYPEIPGRRDYGLWAKMLASGARMVNTEEVLVRATAGRDLMRRRGGLRYARAEIALQRYLVRCGLKGKVQAVIDGLSRAFIFALPIFLRSWIYRNFLRSNTL